MLRLIVYPVGDDNKRDPVVKSDGRRISEIPEYWDKIKKNAYLFVHHVVKAWKLFTHYTITEIINEQKKQIIFFISGRIGKGYESIDDIKENIYFHLENGNHEHFEEINIYETSKETFDKMIESIKLAEDNKNIEHEWQQIRLSLDTLD